MLPSSASADFTLCFFKVLSIWTAPFLLHNGGRPSGPSAQRRLQCAPGTLPGPRRPSSASADFTLCFFKVLSIWTAPFLLHNGGRPSGPSAQRRWQCAPGTLPGPRRLSSTSADFTLCFFKVLSVWTASFLLPLTHSSPCDLPNFIVYWCQQCPIPRHPLKERKVRCIHEVYH